jgi:AcrR family transcriptional regulator
MAVQARAEAMRQAIIDAAVDLFNEVGYGETGLTDIINRAGVTKGAFYYHFPTKESVAAAIIEQAEARKRDALLRLASSPSSALENLIRVSFAVAEMIEQDKLVRVGNLLRQALTQVSSAALDTFRTPSRSLPETVIKNAIAEGDLFDDLDADDVMHTLWAAVLGTRLLADATGDDVYARLAQVWTVILRGIVPPQKLPYFQQFVTRLAQQYTQPDQDASLLNPI